MTAIDIADVYLCPECPEIFTSGPRLGGHVHAVHPERRRPLPKFLRSVPAKPARRDGSLKRATDTWPGKP